MKDITGSPSTLKIRILSESMPAGDLAQLLSALDGSFNSFVRRLSGRGQRPRLAVRAVEHGSIELILESIEGIKKLIGAGKYIAPWATHLIEVIKWYALAQPPKLSPADRKLNEAISKPVADGAATEINIIHNGDIIINIGVNEAANIKAGLRGQQAVQKEPAAATLGRKRLLSEDQIGQLMSGQLIGTAYFAARRWYARMEGGHGVLVPIHTRSGAIDNLVDGQLYRFSGSAELGPLGETIGILLTQASPLP